MTPKHMIILFNYTFYWQQAKDKERQKIGGQLGGQSSVWTVSNSNRKTELVCFIPVFQSTPTTVGVAYAQAVSAAPPLVTVCHFHPEHLQIKYTIFRVLQGLSDAGNRFW